MSVKFFEVETRKEGKRTTYNCDGYATKKTVLGAVHEIGREIAKIDKGEGELLLSAKTKCDALECLVRNEGNLEYCFELEEVSCASRWSEETDEMEYTDGTYYFHIRFSVWDKEEEENGENDVKVSISKGNTKTGAIPAFSLTPGRTCSPEACKTCFTHGCYACKSYKMYPSVRKA